MKHLLAIVMLLSGCASGQAFKPEDIKPIKSVIIYRPYYTSYFSRSFPLGVDGKHCDLANKGYTQIPISQKETTISGSMWDAAGTSSLTIKTPYDDVYFVRVSPSNNLTGGVFYGTIGQWVGDKTAGHGPYDLSLMTRDAALEELKDTNKDCQ